METPTDLARLQTHLHLVLDASDSMLSHRAEVVSAYNEFLAQQRRPRADDLFVTLTVFSDWHQIRTVYRHVPIAEVHELTARDYQPSGLTALYDAVGHTLQVAQRQAGPRDRMVVAILTDGDNNNSRRFSGADICRMRAEREARGNWTFVLLGFGEAVKVDDLARAMGVDPGNVGQAPDITAALVRIDTAMTTYRDRDDLRTGTFYHPPKRWKRPNWTRTYVEITDAD